MTLKPITFLVDSLNCLRDFPDDVRHDAGFQLDKVQRGRQADAEHRQGRGGVAHLGRNRHLSDYLSGDVIRRGLCPSCLLEKNASHGQTRCLALLEALQRIDQENKMTESQTFASVFDVIADTPEQAANLQARAKLMQQIAGRCSLRRDTAADQRFAAWAGFQVFLGCASQYRYSTGVPGSCDS